MSNDINMDEIINKIISGMSLRQISKQYQIDRNSLKARCIEYFKNDPSELEAFERVIRNNKANSWREEIVSQETLEEICLRLCEKRDNLRSIACRLNLTEETLSEKLFQFLSIPRNKELARKYIAYQATLHPDYSHINFKALIVEMIKNDMSQSQIAEQYGIPVRTIGREIEKLREDDEYKELYEICKEYSNRKMKRKPFSSFEQLLLSSVIEKYENEGPIIVEGGKSKRRLQYEKAKANVEKAEQIEGTEAEKAKALGIGISTLRRNRIFVERYEREQEIILGDE